MAEVGDGRVLRKSVASDVLKPYDAHQSISLAVDGSKSIHVAFGAHNSNLLMYRSGVADFDLDASGIITFLPLTSACHELIDTKWTYPQFLWTGSDLLLLCRSGAHFDGELCVFKYCHDIGNWRAYSCSLLSGRSAIWTSGPYCNTPIVTNSGRIVLFYMWRVQPSATQIGEMLNVGVDLLVSDDQFSSVTTRHGVGLAMPVSPLISDRVYGVPFASNLINQSGADYFGECYAAATYWSDGDGVPQYRIVLVKPGRAASCFLASKFATRFKLAGAGTLPLPHSRPEILCAEDGRVVILFRSAEYGNRLIARVLSPPEYCIDSAIDTVLVDVDLGMYEPVLCHQAWHQRREIVLYVQQCNQGLLRDGVRDIASSDASLLTAVLGD